MTSSSTPRCRICGSTEYDLVSRQVAQAPEATIYRCRNCQIVYVFPIMTEEEETTFYRDEFEKYMLKRSGAGWKSPETHFRSYQAEGERRLSLVRPYLHADDALLEVGSSTGYFLDDLRGYVRSVTGVEPSEAYRTFANERGIETLATLDDWGARTFDVIALYYVLEHLRDPIGYLASIHGRLKANGRLLIEVPNVEEVLLTRYHIPSFGPFYWQKAHYHNFSPRTLTDVLARAGFQTQLIPTQRYDLSNHMVWMMEGKPGGMGRFANLFTPELETAYSEALKKQWLCDTVFAVAMVK
ncbi:MAG: class I SAM-dependent methyltransferase [Chloroflexi bacterium]|nr:class I SAM-dependent methyltransferase [Chloroflexota bacterium]